MTQETIAIAIVIFTFLYAIYRIYKTLTTKDKSPCGGCNCSAKAEMRKALKGNQLKGEINFKPLNNNFSYIKERMTSQKPHILHR